METPAAQSGTTDVYVAASCDGGRTFSLISVLIAA
jgi:hypothetical protein